MNRMKYAPIVNAAIVGVALNIMLPMALTPLATGDEIRPPHGAASLSPKGQFMHMIVHHGQIPLMSSLIILIIVALSVFVGNKLKLANHFM